MRYIDLTQVLNETTPIYPGDYQTTLQLHNTIDKDHYCSYLLSSCLHTGTHIDLPMHMLQDPRFVADYDLELFAGKGVLLDVRGEELINMKDCYEEMIVNGSVVLLYTGYDKYYNTQDYFTRHPVVSDELADFLLSKRIKILGMDMPAPDYPPFTLHKALLEKDIFILENLTNLNSLVDVKNFELLAFPLKISAEASFVRAVARIE